MRTKNLQHTLDGTATYQAKLVPNDTWAAPSITGIPAAVLASIAADGPTVKIVGITGNNLNAISADIFLQVWSFPVTADGLTTTGVLIEDTANEGATLVYSKRILDDYSFSADLGGLEVFHGIIAVSDLYSSFSTDALSAAVTVNVEIESNEILPSTYTPPTVDILA